MKICYLFNRPEAIQDVYLWGTNWWPGIVWITCGLLLCIFISCLDFYSDGTHSLLRLNWWATDIMLHFTKSVEDEETNLRVSNFSKLNFANYSVKDFLVDWPGCVWHWWASTPQAHWGKGCWVGPHAGQWWAAGRPARSPGCSSPACLGSPRCEQRPHSSCTKTTVVICFIQTPKAIEIQTRVPFNRDHTLYIDTFVITIIGYNINLCDDNLFVVCIRPTKSNMYFAGS